MSMTFFLHCAKNVTQDKGRVSFSSEGSTLKSDIYYPKSYDRRKKAPAVIVVGSWTTVKEQMAGLYAQRLSEQGLIAVAFDFRNYGGSEGDIRFYESPRMKIQDIRNAVTFLTRFPGVDAQRVGVLGICAGAGYVLQAASEDQRIRSAVTVAAWLHDAEAVKLFYGGAAGVQAKREAAQKATRAYQKTGAIAYVPTISTTDKNAAMYGPYDYYLNPRRGAIREWSADKFAVMSWEDWLTFNPMPSARKITVPVLMIHSDGAVLPGYTRTYFNSIPGAKKRLHWVASDKQSPMGQFDFYDMPDKVSMAVREAAAWYAHSL